MNSISSLLVWIDCEMTGLDPERDQLIEVAAIVTDKDLCPLDQGMSVVIAPSQGALEGMNSYVSRMHKSSGLLDDLVNGVDLEVAQRMIRDYLAKHLKRELGILAGSSIATDRLFINRYLPEVNALLHYRMVDVSTIKELALRWAPEVYENAPDKQGSHRAMSDILESIEELAYYRREFFDYPQADQPA